MLHKEQAGFDELLARGQNNDKRAIGRMISCIETGGTADHHMMQQLWSHTGRARIVGITGSPGTGKSTLADRMVKYWLTKGYRIGVIAVDPSSPFTGGAILGDRVRMNDLALVHEVYIRSMSARGQLGGLSLACSGAVGVLDACGYDIVLIETVGVGQSEVAIMNVADLVLVISVPGLGDDVQAIKAGILEIGDVFGVNKADLPGADRTAKELKAMLDMNPNMGEHQPPVLMVSAERSQGVDELCDAILENYAWMEESGELLKRRNRRLREELLSYMQDRVYRQVLAPVIENDSFDKNIKDFLSHARNPYVWAGEIADRMEEKLK
ncbi:MAG: methylmalonyl Co-A mutase-associated GTPase MeaB [Clostridiales Family XIII bacterium]|jgi:LAO/AO transport system kinase|nr:methylmalonyl Co-A mutase-associated GTPase MeaB [Clostridiales Family XIII bacterium]